MSPAMPLQHTQHIDPHSLPFHALPADVPACRVTLLHYGWLHSHRRLFVDDGWDADEERRERKLGQKMRMPIFGALIETGNGDQYIWDLGWRTDSENLPEVFQKPLPLGHVECEEAALAHNLLWNKGLDKSKLKAIILSHAHVDHYGALDLFDPSIPVYVGPGTMDWINGGDRRGGLKSFPTTYLDQGRRFVQLNQDTSSLRQTPIGPFEEAWDLTGDGSLWLVSTEGHCPGHISLLAHSGNDDWVFLAGDAAHHQSLYLPAPPKPYSHSQDKRSIPSLFKMTPEAATLSCMQDFPDKAWRTLSAMTRLEMQPNIMVLLGHEVELCAVAGLDQAGALSLNDWRQQGWKKEKDREGDRRRHDLNQI